LHPNGGKSALVRYEYDTSGRLIAAYDAAQNADRYAYDDEGRLVREMAKDGGVFTFRYNAQGRCIHTSGLDGFDLKALRYQENIGGTEVTDGHGHVTRYQYLPSGQVSQEINPLGGLYGIR
jgi:YD repeat-containing protein